MDLFTNGCARVLFYGKVLLGFTRNPGCGVLCACVCVETTPSSLTAWWGCGAVKPAGMHPEAAAYHQQAQTGLELNGNTSEHIQCYLGK